MKQLKGFIIVLTGLFIVITLVSLLLPSRVMTMRSVVIKAESSRIYNEIINLENWKSWHPVFMADSNNLHFSDPASGVNAFVSWATNDKENKLLITEGSPDHVRLSLIRKGENNIDNLISINSLSDSMGIRVEWRAFTRLKWYPWEKFAGIFTEKITGPGYEMALNNLKELAEK